MLGRDTGRAKAYAVSSMFIHLALHNMLWQTLVWDLKPKQNVVIGDVEGFQPDLFPEAVVCHWLNPAYKELLAGVTD